MTLKDAVIGKFRHQLRLSSELGVWCINRAHEISSSDEPYRKFLLERAIEADEAVRLISAKIAEIEDGYGMDGM